MKVLHTFVAVAISAFMFLSCSTNNDPDYTLTTSTDPPAAGIITPSHGDFKKGSEVEISATANENMVFSGWRGDFMGSENPTVITMNSNKNLIAFFFDREFPLNIHIEGEGAVSERVLQEKSIDFVHGTFVELTATPADGWKLVEWRGDLSGSDNPGVIKMDKSREVTAVFEKREYALSINIEGEGSVSEQIIQAKSTDYEHGDLIQLTAHPADGWIFSGWDVDLEGNENPQTIHITQEAGVTAIFKPVAEILALRVQGDGTIDIEQIDSDENPSKNRVRLTARPNDGWWFAEWQGDVTGSDNPVEIVLIEEIAVNAVFEIKEYPLTVLTEGEGNVAEQVVQQKTTDYEEGTIVELTANPAQGWEFIEWKGDLSGSENPKQITINSPKEVTAVFAEEPEVITYNLAIHIQGEGSVNIDPQQNEYEPGTKVKLTASPSDGWEFVEWTGAISSTQSSVSITMDSNKSVTAVFNEEEAESNEEEEETTEESEETAYTLAIHIQGEGSVSIDPQQNEYKSGTKVTLTATPSEGWEFDQWEGDLTGTENPASITMESSAEITALFIEQETAFSDGDGSSGNPYRVSTVEQLQTISEFLGSHFIQVNNINAASTSGWNGGEGFSPIGSSSKPFTGTFNGNGFEISGLTIGRDGDNHVGLFGFTGSAQINNTGLVNVNIIGKDFVGGLAGTNNGDISNSYVKGSVTGEEMVGGLVGINNGQITHSHSEATVFSDDDQIGGLAGTNNGEISNSYATGSVTGDESVGGLVGVNRNHARIINSYATGSVSGDDEVGGLAGRNWPNGVIAASYASGSVSGDDETGGFIGWNQASLDSCYWDNQSTNQSNGIGEGNKNGLTGLTTSEMTGSSAEENMSGFNWSDIWITVPNDYPTLR